MKDREAWLVRLHTLGGYPSELEKDVAGGQYSLPNLCYSGHKRWASGTCSSYTNLTRKNLCIGIIP